MRGIIWACDIERGNEKLLEIKQKYQFMQINPTKEIISKSNGSFIAFDNGDCWRVISATESSRGQRANVSYIDRDTPEEIINNVIRPCTISIPYCGYNYY